MTLFVPVRKGTINTTAEGVVDSFFVQNPASVQFSHALTSMFTILNITSLCCFCVTTSEKPILRPLQGPDSYQPDLHALITRNDRCCVRETCEDQMFLSHTRKKNLPFPVFCWWRYCSGRGGAWGGQPELQGYWLGLGSQTQSSADWLRTGLLLALPTHWSWRFS